MRKGLVLTGVVGALLLARSRQRFRWEGKVALIVGGSRGLGLLLARRFGRKGAKVVLAARSEPELLAAQAELRGDGIEAEIAVADVADEAQASRMVELTIDRFGRLDVLVNAASIIQVAPLDALSKADLRAAMDVNFWGTVHACWAALPHLERGARIVNVTSIGGSIAMPHLLPYVCGKFAATGFSEGLQAETARRGLRVVTVSPWLMRTGSAPHALVKGRRKAEAALFHLAASLPFVTLDAGRAADRIVRATERGERFVTVGGLGKILRIAHAVAPGAAGAALGSIARLLPGAPKGAAAKPASEAHEHPSVWTRSPFTTLGRRASERNNELTT